MTRPKFSREPLYNDKQELIQEATFKEVTVWADYYKIAFNGGPLDLLNKFCKQLNLPRIVIIPG